MDEMFVILSDRDTIIQKKEMELSNDKIGDLL